SCELTLNSSGQVESYESYKPYGDIAISFGKTSQQPYKYSGQEKDQSGLYYYGFRSLDPEIFRWTSPDPTGLQGSGLNWYVLVGQNPLTRRDRNGLGPFPFKRLFGDFAKQMLKSSFIGIGGIGLNHVNDRKRGLQKNDEQNLAFGTITTDYYVGILNVETDSNYYKTQTIDEKIELVTGAISAFNKKVVDDRSVRNSNNISR
ncbi:MAG: RHS repeat-associated core domain-containing protein, partial [Reichenbachiella sp.]